MLVSLIDENFLNHARGSDLKYFETLKKRVAPIDIKGKAIIASVATENLVGYIMLNRLIECASIYGYEGESEGSIYALAEDKPFVFGIEPTVLFDIDIKKGKFDLSTARVNRDHCYPKTSKRQMDNRSTEYVQKILDQLLVHIKTSMTISSITARLVIIAST